MKKKLICIPILAMSVSYIPRVDVFADTKV